MQFNISTIVGFLTVVGLASALPGPETSLTKRQVCIGAVCTSGLSACLGVPDQACCAGYSCDIVVGQAGVGAGLCVIDL
ncbi:hypothetical protein FA95DRAFT_1612928 [Auriscalpium vulgare]|uniref:Uncharacterized protein n=1 Tax=Auriscalpium vulgare TaxID=40419 RepID=A0ACB8R546_9AGAM|nr:hypothetical protein FA95DRAFT_1612928 [Auriscalpium vulgare]